MPMSNRQVRVVDPVLSNVALGYADNEFTGHVLFPDIETPKRGGKVLRFSKDKFKDHRENTRRSPGSAVPSHMSAYGSDPIALFDDAMDAQVPFEWLEEGQGLPNLVQSTQAVNEVMHILKLQMELEQAELALNPANYEATNKIVLAPGSKFSDNVNPKLVFDAGKDIVRRQIGKNPNTAHFSPSDWTAFCNNEHVKSQFKYTNADSITEEMAARYLQLDKVVVGKAVRTTNGAVMDDVWEGGTVLAYVEHSERASMNSTSYGYTYRRKDYPKVEAAYEDRGSKSYKHPVSTAMRPYLTAKEAGYLIQNAS